MAEQEAKVVFSETGSESVINGFKNVGAEAGKASTNIGSAGNAIKEVGGGMKSAASNIAQTVTAFATLALSVVSTYRAYRDLGDAQLAVDKANFKVQKSTQAVATAQKLVDKIKASAGKTDLKAVAATSAIIAREEALAKKRKEHSITNKAAKAEQDAINLARSNIGTDKAALLAKAETDLKNKKEALGLATESAAQKQKHFNDATQDFYLSLLPTAISVIATAVSGFESMKNIIGGSGTGLIGSLGGVGLVLGGLSVAILAYQNNWLGFRDVVGGAIDWVKARLDLWKQGFQEVFDLVKKGDWSGAWNRIKEGAAKFWEDLKKSVPFFGQVETLINNIKNGKWSDAFDQIRNAAVFFWVELKKAIPLFGTIENVIAGIRAGDWEGVFTEIGNAIKKGLAAIFGGDVSEKIILKFQLMKATAISEMNLMKDGIKPALAEIQAGLAKLGQGDFVGGFSQIWTGLDKAIGIFITRVNDWIKLNFGIDLVALNQQANAIGVKILDGIKGGLTFVSRTWIDPMITALLDPETWKAGILALGGAVVTVGTAIFNAIAGAIAGAAKDPKGAASFWSDIGNAIWTGITGWFSINLPSAKTAMEGIAQSLVDAVDLAKATFQNVGIAMWNNIIEGIRTITGGAVSPFGAALDALKKTPIELPVKPIILAESKKSFIDTVQNYKPPPAIPITGNTAPMSNKLNAEASKITRGGYVVPKLPVDGNIAPLNKTVDAGSKKITQKTPPKLPVDANTQKAIQAATQAVNKINNMHATIDVRANMVSRFTKMAAMTGQGGIHGTISRDTLIQAHSGERIDIGKPGTHGATGGSGNGNVNVRVFIGDTELKQIIHYTVNEDQGISK